MKTNRPNWDYEKTVVITPQLVKLCDQCGAPMVNRYEVFHCSGCRSTTFEVLYDNQAETFRRGLAEKQYESSIFLAASQRCSLDATENDMDELHRWFAEAEPTLAEQITDEIMRDAAWLDTEPTDAQLLEIKEQEESGKIDEWLPPVKHPRYILTRSWADKHLNSDDDLKHFPGGAVIK